MRQFDTTACDREPIHIPGAVQPHGVLLVLDRESLRIEQAGGTCEDFLGKAAPSLLGNTFGYEVDESASAMSLADCGEQPAYVGGIVGSGGRALDVVGHVVAGKLVLELEEAPARRRSGAGLARTVERIGALFSATETIDQLCRLAVSQFRAVTGFDRVMIYRFLADETGSVLAEEKVDQLPTFLNHRFPASDIPRQARELYVRNVIRVIPDVAYTPSDLVTADQRAVPLDMSNCHLRSVSPVHLQYLHNMGVAASASISILADGRLWGLVACHHRSPKPLSLDDRTLCRVIGASLSQQVAHLEQAELYRARLRSRACEDELLTTLARSGSVDDALASHTADLLKTISAHGVAVRRGGRLWTAGRCPDEAQTRALADWVLARSERSVFCSAALSKDYAAAAAFPQIASGLLAVTLSTAEACQLLWFRAEQIQVIEWAGNPHEPLETDGTTGTLNPRRSFELWRETVRGRSEPWSLVEVEAAERIGHGVADLQRKQRINKLNETLEKALSDRDMLLVQKDHRLQESDHRIQNSLQILSSMLTLQLPEITDPLVRMQLQEALSRMHAVSAVHRRLYRTDQPHVIDVEMYLRELMTDIGNSLGTDWARELRVTASSLPVPTEVAMAVGLVVTELVLNAAKYAYGGRPGPVEVSAKGSSERLQVRVRDHGDAPVTERPQGTGFGVKLMRSLVDRLHGELRQTDASPGLSVTVDVPLHVPEHKSKGQGPTP
ncbi:MAG: GAF domain-containing protein [Rhodospirillales bacterium]